MKNTFPIPLPLRRLVTAAIALPLSLVCLACGARQKEAGEKPAEKDSLPAKRMEAGVSDLPETGIRGIPASATIIDSAAFAPPGRAGRLLYLWSLAPQRHPRETPDEPYTCPEETRGSYYRGVIRLSLADAGTRSVINTIAVGEGLGEQDTFDIPYSIQSGLHYPVPGVPEGTEGRPALLSLRDYNGDGAALEFPLFNAEACMGLQTALFGYSVSRDRVMHYPIELSAISGSDTASAALLWIDRLFREKPSGAGRWNYSIDYRGRGGTLDTYDIRYDASREKFTGTLVSAGEE